MDQAVSPRPRLFLRWLALLAFPCALFGHRLDEYLQATLVFIERASIRLDINLVPGIALTDDLLAAIDRDQDGLISPAESAAYAATLQRDLTVRLDRQDLALKVTSCTFPAHADLREGTGIIQIELSAQIAALPPGTHTLRVENRHRASASIYLLNAALPASPALQIVSQTRSENQSAGEIAFTVR